MLLHIMYCGATTYSSAGAACYFILYTYTLCRRCNRRKIARWQRQFNAAVEAGNTPKADHFRKLLGLVGVEVEVPRSEPE